MSTKATSCCSWSWWWWWCWQLTTVHLLNNVMCVSCSPSSQDKSAAGGHLLRSNSADPDVCSLTPVTDCAPTLSANALQFGPRRCLVFPPSSARCLTGRRLTTCTSDLSWPQRHVLRCFRSLSWCFHSARGMFIMGGRQQKWNFTLCQLASL